MNHSLGRAAFSRSFIGSSFVTAAGEKMAARQSSPSTKTLNGGRTRTRTAAATCARENEPAPRTLPAACSPRVCEMYIGGVRAARALEEAEAEADSLTAVESGGILALRR